MSRASAVQRLAAASNPRAVGVVVVSLLLALAPAIVGSSTFRISQYTYIVSLVMVAIGLNIVTGFAGQLSLGPSAVFAVGGYVAAALANHFPTHVGLLLMALGAMAGAGVFGLLVGIPALRVGGFYLANVTLFFALLVPIVASNLSVTGKDNGISLLANPDFTQSPSGVPLYEVTIAVMGVLALLSWALLHSRVGRGFVVLRTSEELAAALGIPGYRTKMLAFFLSALPAGLGGAFYVFSQQFIAPGSVNVNLSIYLIAACVIGGLGTSTGPVIGGLVVIGLNDFLGSFAQYQGIIFGIALAVFAIALPRGIVGSSRQVVVDVLSNARRLAGPKELERRAAPEASVVAATSVPRIRPPNSGETELAVEGAVRSFGGVRAVDGADLRVVPGQMVGLIGSNGSGKTTILNLISGFYALERGLVRIGERRIDGMPAWKVAREGVARTFQTPQLVGTGTVLENVLVSAETRIRCNAYSSVLRLPPGPATNRRAVRHCLEALDRFGLAGIAREQARNLPHGTRRMVELARAVASDPAFLLLDEPAAGLSPSEIDQLQVAILDVTRSGVGVLLIEHNVPLVLEMAEEVTVLHEGRVLLRGNADAIRRDEMVSRVFLGTELSLRADPTGPTQ